MALIAFGWHSIESLKYKDYELKRVVEQAEQAVKQQAVNALNLINEKERDLAQSGIPEKAKQPERSLTPIDVKLPRPKVPDDPQKGRFGGRSENNDRELDANVSESGSFFRLDVWVKSLDPAKPLVGQVDFYVHDTFSRTVYSVMAGEGRAAYDFYVYGAFTIGAVCDGGNTLLELDLSTLPGAPKKFRES